MCAAVVGEKLACLWGKPQKRVFLHVSEDVLVSFCVAGVALRDIRRVKGGICVRDRPWQKNWRVYGGSMGKPQNVYFSTCQKMLSYRFAWHPWHFVTFDV